MNTLWPAWSEDAMHTRDSLHTTPSQQAVAARYYPSDHDFDGLPDYYDAEGAPAYSRHPPQDGGQQLDGSALVFSLRHMSRKRQAFISMGPPLNINRGGNRFTEVHFNSTPQDPESDLPYPWNSTSRKFIIDHKSGAGFSKSKPDFVITAADREQRADSVPPPVRRKSSLFRRPLATRDATPGRSDSRHGSVAQGDAARQTQPIASVRFARSGPLPWTPRANIIYEPAFVQLFGHDRHNLNENRKQDMMLKRADLGWTISIFDRDYMWCLLKLPNRLALVDTDTDSVKATFIYSEVGTAAEKDGEIGRLSVPLQSLPDDAGRSGLQEGFMEYAICSLTAAIEHWKNEGRIIFNCGTSRSGAGSTSGAYSSDVPLDRLAMRYYR